MFVLRVDVDNDIPTTRRMASILYQHRVTATFYFRASTADVALMRHLYHTGFEVGYHYEELSTHAKLYRTSSTHEMRALLPLARDAFLANISRLRRSTRLPLVHAAAHGDWINRKLKVSNTELLNDPAFRRNAGILTEAYDLTYRAPVVYHIDRGYPFWWSPADPRVALQHGLPCVYVTVHPRQWVTNIAANLKDDILRLYEATCYFVGTARIRAMYPRH